MSVFPQMEKKDDELWEAAAETGELSDRLFALEEEMTTKMIEFEDLELERDSVARPTKKRKIDEDVC